MFTLTQERPGPKGQQSFELGALAPKPTQEQEQLRQARAYIIELDAMARRFHAGCSPSTNPDDVARRQRIFDGAKAFVATIS